MLPPNTQRGWVTTLLFPAFLFFLAFVLYLSTMPPTVLEGDNGEFQYMAYILGVPHSTGYPLYILLAKLFTFLPLRDVAWRVTFFSVVTGALTAPMVYALALRLIHQRVPALLATLIFVVTPSMWGGAIETKAYALHLFLGALAILFALHWHQDGNARDFFALAFVYGLNLTNHPTIRFLAPALLLIVWLNRARVNRALLAKGVLLALLPLLLYAYIPIRANYLIAQQDPANWELYSRADAILKGTVTAYYNNTPQGFINLISGLDNTYKIGFKSEVEQANRLDNAAALLFQQFGIIGIVLAMVGAIRAFRQNRGEFAFVALAAAGMGLIALYLRGVSTVYYFSLMYLALALWIGFGIDALLKVVSKGVVAQPRWASGVGSAAALPPFSDKHLRTGERARLVTRRVVVTVLLLLPFSALVVNFPKLDQSNSYDARDFAQAVLDDHLPQNAVVIAPWEVSQPMRYFQFVENQRPDLLVVNVSPIWPQFETMLNNARKLGRPFYQVQFTPEDFNLPPPRSVQAVPLPLLEEPRPRYMLNKKIVNEVEIIGYDLDPDPPQPGKPARVLIYYRTLDRMYPMYSAILSVTDILNQPWGNYDGFPASPYYPTYRWQTGDVYRDVWTIRLPADAPSGLYAIDLNWYVYDLATHTRDESREFGASLGTIRVGDIPSTTPIAQRADTQSANGIAFLGWNATPTPSSNSVSIARGQPLTLDLFWRTDRAQKDTYTVFVHLADASGRVVADADAPPSRGLYPTDRWSVGEIVRDRHMLIIPSDLPAGEYRVKIGMYLPVTGQRVLFDGADQIALTVVRVQ